MSARLSGFGLLTVLFALIPRVGEAGSPVSATLVPTRPGIQHELLARIKRLPGVREVAPVFSQSEAISVADMGDPLLAISIRIELASEEAFINLETAMRGDGTLDRNSAATPLAAKARSSGDPILPEQWGLVNTGTPQGIYLDSVSTLYVPGIAGEDIRLPLTLPHEPKPVTIAILDTGVDWEHPELEHALAKKPGECETLAAYQACLKTETRRKCDERYAKIDTDGNGYPMDCTGWNVTAAPNAMSGVQGDALTDDDQGHGTHIAGIIAAESDNNAGGRGAAPHARILPVKVIRSAPNSPIRPQSLTLQSDPLPVPTESSLRWTQGFADVIARGMLYALRSDAQVINMSLAWPAGVDSAVMKRMIGLAHTRGVVVIAAAGNDSTDSRVFPCSYSSVICVGSHGPDGAFSHFSNHGAFVDVLAPGLRILSTWPIHMRATYYTRYHGHELKNGTSMAAPYVAAAAAILLGQGIEPSDVLPRLIASSRPIRASSHRGPELSMKYARGGNLDINAALGASPSPLILASDKAVIKTAWDRQTQSIPVSIRLKNFWAPATSVEITASLRSYDSLPDSTDDAEMLALALDTDAWTLTAWDRNAEQNIETMLRVRSMDFDGRFSIELAIRADSGPTRRVRVPVEVHVPIDKSQPLAGFETLPITLGQGAMAISPRATLRTVKAIDPSAPQEYAAIERIGQELSITLLRPSTTGYEASATARIALPAGEFSQIQRVGDSYRVLLKTAGPQGSNRPMFRFVTLAGDDLRVTDSLDYDNKVSLVSERFQWVQIDGNYVPAWIGFGTTPALDKPPFDPWKPRYQDVPATRLYYLAPEGLRIFKIADTDDLIQTLTPSPDERRNGVMPIVISRGNDYRKTFYTARVRGRQITDIDPIDMPSYRMLMGIPNVGDVTGIGSASGTDAATFFAADSSEGALRATIVSSPPSARARAESFTARSRVQTDSVMRVIGVFADDSAMPAATSVFLETHYDLNFQDLATGDVATTSLNRFSFIPSFIFGRSYVPVIARDAAKQIPAVLVPTEPGDVDGVEIILPRRTSRGLHLSRPATLRLLAKTGCQALGNPMAASPGTASAAIFFCGDRFIRVPFDL